MAQQVELQITHREVEGKAVKRLRKQGLIPANIFGHHQQSTPIQVSAFDFDRLRRSHGATGIIALRLADSVHVETALIRHVQRDPRTGKIIHVDFFRVRLDERLNVKVALRLIGESPAVKDAGGVLLHLLDTLEIECRADEIPEYIDVDVTPLAEIDAMIHAEEVQLPPNIKLITDPKEGVVKVAATRAEAAAGEAEKTEAAASETAPAAEGQRE